MLLVHLMLAASCTCSQPNVEAPPPHDPGPSLWAWTGPPVDLPPGPAMRARGWDMPFPELPTTRTVQQVELRGDAVAQADDLHQALGHEGPSAITTATAERVATDDELRIRVRWALHEAPQESSANEPAPSWEALCDGAVACFRTGPWPDVGGWLTAVPPDASTDALPVLWGGEWPHVVAGLLQRERDRLPEVARGFFDTAVRGLNDVAFAGGRLQADGTVLAFARVPAEWVNFTSGVLGWTGLPPSRPGPLLSQ